MNVLPLQSQFIFSLLLFVIKSREQYKANFEIHCINTRHATDLHPPSRLTMFQKWAFYFGIKDFNHLPSIIENLYHEKEQFRHALKRFLLSWVRRDQLDATCFIITLFSAQHVSDINTSILRSLRLIRKVTSWVVSVRSIDVLC